MNSVDTFGQAAYKAFIDQAPENNFLPPWGALSPEKREAWRPTEGERHTALGDARWVQRLYDKIMGDA